MTSILIKHTEYLMEGVQRRGEESFLNPPRVYIKGSKNWYTGKVIACGCYFYFAPDAAVNFLERELGMKRGVNGGKHFPFHFQPWSPNQEKVSIYGVNGKTFI